VSHALVKLKPLCNEGFDGMPVPEQNQAQADENVQQQFDSAVTATCSCQIRHFKTNHVE